MRKGLAIFTMLLTMLSLSLFAESEKISMGVGSQRSQETGFVIDSFKLIPSNQDQIKVEAAGSILRIQADKVGTVSVIVTGNGEQKEYEITVKTNLDKILKRLRSDLDLLTELTIAINEDQIKITGEVTNPEHWALLQKVLPNYSGKCINLATFKPNAETIQNLKKMLEDAGIKVVDTTNPADGELSMTLSSNVVIITGQLYSQNELDKVNQILSTQPWLSVNEPVDGKSGKIRGIVNMKVIESLLEVEIVYLGVTDSEGKKIGSSDIPVLQSTYNILYNMISGTFRNQTAQIGANMTATTRFLAKNGLSRMHNAGHVTFANNDPKGGELFTGGTTKVKVSGVENGSLQDVDYGLKINVKGGLVSPDRCKLELNLENSTLIGSDGDSYTMSKDTTKQTVYVDLDKTVILAGSRKIAQETSKSGLPFLRNAPVLSWFVAQDSGSKDTTSLLILVCPRLSKPNADVQIEIPLSEELSGDTKKKGETDTKETIKEQNKKKSFWKRIF
ncbi:MAG: hypothetical protein J5833_05540 [Victivallales bacterium]|nr:hypothetical protein [Victivallales bacterium]